MVTKLGKFLRMLRIERDELMKDMSDKLSITPSYLSSIENGKRIPSYNMINKISIVYQLDEKSCNQLLDTFRKTVNEIEEQQKERTIYMELKDTIRLMESADYKERFKAEYYQLKIRTEKLRAFIVKYEAGTLRFSPSCTLAELKKQLNHMTEYLYMLDVRAQIEQIDL